MKLDLNKTRIDLEAAVMKLGEMNNEWTNKLKGNFNLIQEFNQVIVIELQPLQNF